MMTHPAAMATVPDGDIERQRRDASKDLLQQMETRARGAGVEVSAAVLSGDIYKELFSHITTTAPDLVVMGTHARHGFDRWLYGSMTEKTIRHCPVPILVIPDATDAAFPVPPAIGRILVATDSVGDLERTLDRISMMHEGTEIHILHVVSKPEDAKDALVGLSSVIDVLADRPHLKLNRKHVVPEVEVGAPDDRILSVAGRSNPDLIVVNPHDRSWLARLFGATTVEPVVREAPCPVMTVPDGLVGRTTGTTAANAQSKRIV
jgi:nucleotide-binding universal stress UspA family protein